MIRLLLALALCLFTVDAALAQTVILVRHAEKADQTSDPALSEPGQARAQALAAALANAGITNVLVTPPQRTRLTGLPAAAARGLTPEVVSLEGGGAAHIDRVVARIRALPPTAVVLVVGHSNTVPEIAAALTGAAVIPMPDCEYDRLTVIAVPARASVTARYGPPSACPPPAVP